VAPPRAKTLSKDNCVTDDMSIPNENTALKWENAELRRRLEEIERDSSSQITQFHDLAVDSGAWVWRIDMQGRYTFSSDLVEEILGYTASEVIGRPFYAFFHPEDRERLQKLGMEAIGSGCPFLSFRNRNVRKDGATVILETTGFPIVSAGGEITGYYGGDRDVTALVHAESARREGETMFQHMFEELGDAAYVALWDDDGSRRIVEANREALQRVGGRSEGLIGKDLLRDFQLERIEPNLDTIENVLNRGETARYVISRICSDGHERWEEVVEVPMTYRGRLASLSISRDITERKRIEDELLLGREQWRAQYKRSPVPTMTWRYIEGNFELTNYNDALVEMTDGKISTYLGKRASEMYPDRPEIIGAMKECYRTHHTLQGEVEHHFVTTGQVRTVWVTTGFVPPDLVIVHLADLSTRKKMERDLQAANEDLQRILDVMGEGVVVLDEDGRMTRLNKKACELFGRAEEDILGHDYSFWTHPDSRDLLATEQGKRMRGMHSAYDARLMREDGIPFWAHIIAVPVINGVGEFRGSVGCLRDVTQEKQALAELERLHEFNEQLIRTAGVWINVTDRSGNIILWNDEAEQISGYSREEVVGNDRIWEWLYPDPENRANIRGRQRKIRVDDRGLQLQETVIRCKNGEERAIQWHGRPRCDSRGQVDGWVIAGHDVTESKNNMQRLQDYAAQVERLSREKTRFLSVASHELRTPLTIVNGFVDLLAEDKPRPDQKAKLVRVQLQLERLTQLLDDLLSVSRIDTGKSNLSPSPIDLNEITRKVVDLLTPQAVAKGLRIVLRNDHSAVDAYADAGALMQIVTNILLNAISYTPGGGKIVVSVSGCSNKGQVVISDTGMGICEEERELIFSEFHRSDRARKVKANGNGLGLSIVKRLLDQMNGTIWVKSAGAGKGSTFSITLPGSAPKESKEEDGDAVSNL